MTRIGTCRFASKEAAMSYYKDQNETMTRKELRAMVHQKINEGLIFIGPPKAANNETLSIIDGRYHISTP